MNRISRNISIIVRSERLIAQRRLAVLRRQTGMMAAAGVAGGVGLLMLNAAGYLALSTVVSPAAAALIVAIVNLAIAAILVSIATNTNAEADVAPVAEVRDLALEDLEAEIKDATDEARELADSVRRMARDPLGLVGSGAIGAIATAVVKNLKK
ncbi:MAG: hypothetical protein QNI90_15225 [Dinoroseobacter sp.]|nr:hypothetical protein [Dinoroseobacter sp.]